MLARVFSCAVIGLDGVIVEVEVDTSQGLPSIVIVGLPDAAVQESRERVQAAVRNAGVPYPRWFPDFAFGYGYIRALIQTVNSEV